MYDLNVKFTGTASLRPYTANLTFPSMKLLKNFVREGIKDGSIADLDSVNRVMHGHSIKGLVDVTKWFFESFHASHATKAQKKHIELKYEFESK